MLRTLAIENYRSLRSLVLPLGSLTVVRGANGTGKSSLYRALRLLAESARNGAVAALAREGGMTSTLWAGPETISRAMRSGEHEVQGTRRRGPVSLRLGFASDDYGYAIDLGLPVRSSSAFHVDPEIKRECTWSGPVARPSALLTDRRGGVVRTRGDDGEWAPTGHAVSLFDSMLSEYGDPDRAPEVLVLRERMRGWRFYDHVRTDAAAPARSVAIGTRTPVLAHDGADLAAAWQTIIEIGDVGRLHEVLELAFPGSRVEISTHDGLFSLVLHQPGMLRGLSVAEVSDGTLRFLLLLVALLTPRPPELMVLNEPESSLHPDLLPALAHLMVTASQHCQILAVTHSEPLHRALETEMQTEPGMTTIELTKDLGETRVVEQERLGGSPWTWPAR